MSSEEKPRSCKTALNSGASTASTKASKRVVPTVTNTLPSPPIRPNLGLPARRSPSNPKSYRLSGVDCAGLTGSFSKVYFIAALAVAIWHKAECALLAHVATRRAMRLPFAVCTSPSEECPKSMNEEKGFPTPSASNTEAHGSLQHSARRNCTVAVFDRCWSLLPAEAMESRILALAAVWMTLAAAVRASDPELTTDFAVPAGVDPATINSTFFTFIGFRGGVQAPNGTFGVKRAFEGAFPALHGLGVSIAIVEYFPGTTNPPHTHPRGTEVLYVLEGVLNVGLVDSTNKFFGQVLQAGDVFVFPKGLIHYQINLGKELVRAVASFSSSNPGTVQVGANLFASGVPDIALTTAFKVEKSIIDTLQAAFAPV